MKIIGITGGVGTGKSKVLAYMEEQFKAVVCQADHVAWELQRPGEICYKQIINEFGEHILNQDKTINRPLLGSIVFSDALALQKLNQIMHPAVKMYILQKIEEEKTKHTTCFVIEAALLLETHYDEICDEIWYIYFIKPANDQLSSIATEAEIYSLSGVSAKSTTITAAPNNETRIKPMVSNKKLRRNFAVGAPKIL